MGYNADLQKVFVKPEAAYGDGASGDFSGATGLRLWPTEMVDLSGVVQQMTDVQFSLGTLDEIGPEGVPTFKVQSLSTNIIFPGATRSSGITEDNFSKFGSDALGVRYATGADEAADVGATATSVAVKGATVYTAGKSAVMINGEVRLIATWSAPTMTFNTPLSAAPAEDDVVYDVETFVLKEQGDSLALGFVHDDPNADYLIKGAYANIDAITIVNAETAKLSLSWMAGDSEVGAAKVTAESTNEIQSGEVVPSNGGGYFVKDSAGTDVDNPCIMQAEISAVGMDYSPVGCFGATNGVGGYQKVPTAGGSIINMTIFEDETPMFAEFVSLVGSERENILQMGHLPGAIVGVIQPVAAIGTQEGYPHYTNEDRKEYFTTTWKGNPVILFRA